VDANHVSNLDRVVEVVNAQDPDILCLQEVYPCWELPCLLEFLRKTLFEHCLRWQGCAVLSKQKITIREYGKEDNTQTVDKEENLKKEEAEEDNLEKEGGAYHKLLEKAPGFDENRPRYITVEASNVSMPSFYISCIHLFPKYSELRLEEVQRIKSDLAPLFNKDSPQIWAGDFNTLCQSDYSEEEWNDILELRKTTGREVPSSDVTNAMEALGFRDSWVEANKPPPRTTSRFDTRVDYVYTSQSFNKSWSLKSLLHFPHDASDHSCVIATFALK